MSDTDSTNQHREGRFATSRVRQPFLNSVLTANQELEPVTQRAAIVFYPDGGVLNKLSAWLSPLPWLKSLELISSESVFWDALADYPDAMVVSTPGVAQKRVQCDRAPDFWVVAGQTNEDALSAFSAGSTAFIALDADDDTVSRALRRLHQRHLQACETSQYRTIFKGLCRQYGLSEAALSATLRRQHRTRCQPGKVGVKTSQGWCCLSPDEIVYVEAAGDYMCIHTASETHTVRSTMKALMARFSETELVCCHRSVAVNIKHVHTLPSPASGVPVVQLRNGIRIKISRRCYTAYWQSRTLASDSTCVSKTIVV